MNAPIEPLMPETLNHSMPDAPAGSGAAVPASRFWVRRIESPAGVGVLEAVSLAYIGIPVLIFFFGWLRLPLALVLGTALVFLLAHSALRAVAWARDAYAGVPPPDAAMDNESLAFRALLLPGIVAFAVLCTGVGGFTFQFTDYWYHDGIMRMLIDQPWPPGITVDAPTPNLQMSLVYYYANYLPGALVGRALGWDAARAFAYLWNTLGTLLAVIWFMRLVGTFRLRYALLFLLFGGVDVIGYVFTAPLPDGTGITWLDYLTGTFWWSTGRGWMAHWSANYSLLSPEGHSIMGTVFYRFYGMLSYLFDGPWHVLPSWVLLLVVLHDAIRRRTVERLFFLTSLLPLCSIFVTVGTVPVLLVATLHVRGRKLLTLGNVVAGPAIVLVFMLWYLGIECRIPNDWVWNFVDVNRAWGYLFLYYFCGFVLYALVAPTMRGNGYRPGRLWFYGAVAVFLLAPWYRLGLFNDLTTKVVIPSQLVFLVCLATALRNPEGKAARLRRGLLAASLAVGSLSSLGIVYRAMDFGFSFAPTQMERVPYFADMISQEYEDNRGVFDKPMCHQDTFFWKHLARPAAYLRSPENKPALVYDFRDPANQAGGWRYCDHEHRMTDDGLVIETPGNTALVMCEGLNLDTRAIGSVLIDNTVVDEKGNTPDYEIGFQWANADDIRKAQSDWPFHRWRYIAAYPRGKHLSSNSFWRGQVNAISLYLKVNGDPEKQYTVTLRSLTFLQR